MRLGIALITALLMITTLVSCKKKETESDMNIIFLHHSTGRILWKGEAPSFASKVAGRISSKLGNNADQKGQIPDMLKAYNKENGKNYRIEERIFPKAEPYGWHNYPYDYYNIWVKNAGNQPFMEEPTLEILSKDYQVIIFKHCFPVSTVQPDQDSADINSDLKTLGNYKLQYAALKDKLHEFPETKFILFTGAALTESSVSEDKAMRAREFFQWVKNEWDAPGDNIYIWDLHELETEGGLYLLDKYANSPSDSHPNVDFAKSAGQLLFNRIIDVIENNGNGTQLTGKAL